MPLTGHSPLSQTSVGNSLIHGIHIHLKKRLSPYERCDSTSSRRANYVTILLVVDIIIARLSLSIPADTR